MGVRTYEEREELRPVRRSPSVGATVIVFVLVLLGLLANGRTIGNGDVAPLTWAATAATAPILALSRLGFALDAAGLALAGKLASASFAALAAGLLFQAVGRRRPTDDAWTTALLFAFGTTIWASAQCLSPATVSTALVTAALLLLVLSEDVPKWAPVAGLPLGLAFAANPADLGLVAVLAFSALLRRPRHIGLWALWAAPGILLWLAEAGRDGGLLNFGFGPDWGTRLAALVAGPADGLLVFAPLALVGLVGLIRALGRDDAPLATGCLAALLVHGVVIAGRPWGSGTWGPRDWTDAMPLVLIFLPDGLDVMRGLGTALAAASVAVQALAPSRTTRGGTGSTPPPPRAEAPSPGTWPGARSRSSSASEFWSWPCRASMTTRFGSTNTASSSSVPAARGSPPTPHGSLWKARMRPSGTFTFREARGSRRAGSGYGRRGTRCSCECGRRATPVISSCASPGGDRARSS